jgi:DNA repair exonuclease SbcCD ATPase subunit
MSAGTDEVTADGAADPKAQLARALQKDGPLAALEALRWATDWVARTIDEATRVPADAAAWSETLPIQAVIALDDVLTAARPVTDWGQDLLSAARLGPSARERLRDRQRQLDEIRAGTTRERSILEDLLVTEGAITTQLGSLDALRRRVTELRRLERLARALDELRTQRDLIEARIAALGAGTAETTTALQVRGSELVVLTEDRLTALGAERARLMHRVNTVTDRLADQTRRLESTRAELAAFEEKYEQLTVEHTDRVASLRRYAAADQEIADALAAISVPDDDPALSQLDQVRNLARDAETRLAAVDRALRAALTAHAGRRASAHAVIGWSDPA